MFNFKIFKLMNEQALKQIAMAKVAIKNGNSSVKGSLIEAQNALWSAMEDLTDGLKPLDMLEVNDKTLAIGAINQLYDNITTLLAE